MPDEKGWQCKACVDVLLGERKGTSEESSEAAERRGEESRQEQHIALNTNVLDMREGGMVAGVAAFAHLSPRSLAGAAPRQASTHEVAS